MKHIYLKPGQQLDPLKQSCPKCCKMRWTCGDDFLCDDPLLCTLSGDNATPDRISTSGIS